MANKIFSRVGAMCRDEWVGLDEIRRYLAAFRVPGSGVSPCVLDEAWRIAKYQRRNHPPKTPQPKPQRSHARREAPKLYRAERRNAMFGRPHVGNRKGGS